MSRWLVESTESNVDRLVALSHNSSDTMRAIAAGDPATPIELLEELSRDRMSDVRLAVARNSSTPDHVLMRLAKDEMWIVRYHTATNPNLPNASMIELATDDDYQVREGAAENPNLTVGLSQRLSQDESVGVRRNLAENPSTRPEILRELAKSGISIRIAVASNHNAPVDLLIKLMSDPIDSINTAAKLNLEKRRDTANSEELQQIEDAITLMDLGLLEARRTFQKK